MRNAILIAALIFAAPAQAAGLDDTLRAIFNGPGPAASVYWAVSKHRTHKPALQLPPGCYSGRNPDGSFFISCVG